jgi:hypothetical protein
LVDYHIVADLKGGISPLNTQIDTFSAETTNRRASEFETSFWACPIRCGTAWLMAACIQIQHEGQNMIIRAASILVVVLGLSPGAMAGSHTGVLHRMSCTMVRYYVALYSATAAEQYARGKGATNADIEVARHCIKS